MSHGRNTINESVAAKRRIRRGRPDFFWSVQYRIVPGRTVAAGGPLRAEGFPKRRCHFESVAAQPHLSPMKSLKNGSPVQSGRDFGRIHPTYSNGVSVWNTSFPK